MSSAACVLWPAKTVCGLRLLLGAAATVTPAWTGLGSERTLARLDIESAEFNVPASSTLPVRAGVR